MSEFTKVVIFFVLLGVAILMMLIPGIYEYKCRRDDEFRRGVEEGIRRAREHEERLDESRQDHQDHEVLHRTRKPKVNLKKRN